MSAPAGRTGKPVGGELGRIQSLLREEVLKLRELMQQMKAIEVDSQTRCLACSKTQLSVSSGKRASAHDLSPTSMKWICPSASVARFSVSSRKAWSISGNTAEHAMLSYAWLPARKAGA